MLVCVKIASASPYRYKKCFGTFFKFQNKKVYRNYLQYTLKGLHILFNNYIYIINVRFSGEIHFIKEIEEGVTDVPMPAMILQPLVENSINHGLRDVEWENKIWLSVYRENNRICGSVRDNGIGISPEQTQSILNNDLNGNGLQEHTTGVGLRNVIGRLRLFYNRDDVMEITSTGSGMGTEVAVFIPV